MRAAVIVAWLLLPFQILTHQRVPAWHDNLSLWTAAVRVTPEKPRALANLALAYDAAKQPQIAMEYWGRLTDAVCSQPVPRRPFGASVRPIVHGGNLPCSASSPSAALIGLYDVGGSDAVGLGVRLTKIRCVRIGSILQMHPGSPAGPRDGPELRPDDLVRKNPDSRLPRRVPPVQRRPACRERVAGVEPVATAVFPWWPALLTVAIFWLHPIQSEAVGYVTGRSELIVGLGCLLTSLTIVRFRWWLAPVFGLGIAITLAGKPAGILALLPVVLLGPWLNGGILVVLTASGRHGRPRCGRSRSGIPQPRL